MQQRQQSERQQQSEQRHRRQRRGELRIRDLREAADHHVLRIAGDRRRRADIRRHRHRQQIGHRIAPQAERQFQHQRRHHQADRVVHQEGREHAGHHDDRRQQQQRPVHVARDPGVDQGEEAGDAQIGDHDHHAEQQRDGAEIDRLVRFLQRHDAGGHHQAGADQRDAGAVDRQPRHLADRQRQIAGGEDADRGEAAAGRVLARA